MKKKLMMVAVLLGALSLGACVDNDESASVTAVRNAKAEQLKGLAALANAQAEATKITAEAEAALKNARAEYQKEMTEEAKQKFAVKIEQIKAEAEKAIAAAKLQAAQDQQSLLDLADKRLRGLYASYKFALGDLVQLNNDKIELVADIASAEESLIPFTTQKQIAIDRLQRKIENEKFKIETYAKYEGVNKTELEQKATVLYKDYQKAGDVVSQKNAAQQEAQAAYAPNPFYYYGDKVTLKTVKAAGELCNNYYIAAYSPITETNTLLAGDYSIDYYTLNAKGVESTKQVLNNSVKYYENLIGTDKDKADQNGSYYAKIAYYTAQKAEILKADPDADVSWYDNQISQMNANITSDKIELKKAQDRVTEFNVLVAAFSGDDLKAYDAAVAELKTLAVALDKADKELQAARDAQNKALSEWQIAFTLAGQNNVDNLVETCKNNIAGWESEIYGYEKEVTDKETLIQQQKAELETLNTQIEAQTAIVNNWKAQIEAAIEAQK